MCGICGLIYFDSDRHIDPHQLEFLADSLNHRGPDDAGQYIDRNVGLAHRRLSIIDLSGGHQPMSNEGGTLWIVFNGEIYNFQEHRDRLSARGHIFRTRSDTEVILHLYEEFGSDCVDHLNGIFAFAIWDRRTRTAFLARDHFGVKPLYYYCDKSVFLFASEIKAILRHDAVSIDLEESHLPEYLTFRYIAGANTLYRKIYKLQPGECATVSPDGGMRISSYWEPQYRSDRPGKGLGHYQAQMDDLIQRAVELQLMSDVPLGTFCSGGVDSSLVSAIASKKTTEQLKTFTIGFREKQWDERGYATIAAESIGSLHRELVLDNREFSRAIPRLIWYNDEPLSHPNSVQMYFLSLFSREFVKVILTGEGADEQFLGYPRYQILRLYRMFAHLPGLAQRVLSTVLSQVPGRRVGKLRDGFAFGNEDEALIHNSMFVHPGVVRGVMGGSVAPIYMQHRSMIFEAAKDGTMLERLYLLDMKTYLVSALERLDKMSMACGLECRVPMLDRRLTGFASSVPAGYKLRGFENKYILKKIAERYIPRDVIYRPKYGLGVPLNKWVAEKDGLGMHLPLVQDGRMARSGLFDPEEIERRVKAQLAGRERNGELLWLLINFRLWLDVLDRLKEEKAVFYCGKGKSATP